MKKFLHRVLTVVFAGFVFIGAQAFGFTQQQAFADDTVVSPYGYYYKGTPDESVVNKGDTAVEGAKNQLKNTVDSVRGNAKDLVNSAKKGLAQDDTFDGAKNNLRGIAKDAADATNKGIKDAAKSANVTGENGTVKSPYGYYYKGTPDPAVIENDASSISNNPVASKNPLESIADNVREKLNLDEPLPESTKEFLGSTEERIENVVEPVTGKKEGYHQIR